MLHVIVWSIIELWNEKSNLSGILSVTQGGSRKNQTETFFNYEQDVS